jgi:pimeloyl-ACP methyl ester carboxylesterase
MVAVGSAVVTWISTPWEWRLLRSYPHRARLHGSEITLHQQENHVRRPLLGRRAGLGVVVGLALGLTVSCTVGPSDRPSLVIAGNAPKSASTAGTTPSGRPSTLPPLERPSDQISWSDCSADTRQRIGNPAPPASLSFQCGRVIAPLDPSADQSGNDDGVVRLSLLKVGSGPTPLVVVNDLDGLPGTLYAARLAAELPASFLKTVSLIGLDRRGTGGSDGVHCVPQADRDQIAGYDPADTNLDDLLTASRDASQQCVLDMDTRSAALNTINSAADLELLRGQLGLTRLDAIGHGEGSRVLTTYADAYPGKVGRFVLDGAPDPQLNTSDTAQAQADSAEATFNAFAQDCVNRGNCPLGTNARGALTALVSQIRQTPLSTSDGSQVDVGEALQAVRTGLADHSEWPALASAIAAARTGDASGLAALVAPLVLGSDFDPPRLDAELVSGCNDETDRLAPAQVSAAITAWGKKDPLFGAAYAQQMLWCAAWPVPDQKVPAPAAVGAPPILVLSTANDPVTPQAGTQKVASELAGGVLVSWQGSGHGALGVSACATTAATGFLANATVPQNPTSCPP